MKKVLNVTIPYGIENPSFLNFKINKGKKMISCGHLNMDGTAFVEIWNRKEYNLDEVNSSILFDFVNGNKSIEDVDFYLHLALLEIDGVFDETYAKEYQPAHKDSHELYLMHNFCAESMDEVEKEKESEETQKDSS